MDPYLDPDIMTTILVRRNLQGLSLKADTVIRGHGALILFAKDVVDVCSYPGDKS